MLRIENKTLNIYFDDIAQGEPFSVFSKPLEIQHVRLVLKNLAVAWEAMQDSRASTFASDGRYIFEDSSLELMKKYDWNIKEYEQNKQQVQHFIQILLSEYMHIIYRGKAISFKEAIHEQMIAEDAVDKLFSPIFFCMLQLRYYGDFVQKSYQRLQELKIKQEKSKEEEEELLILSPVQFYTSLNITEIMHSTEISCTENEPSQQKVQASYIVDLI